MIKKIQNIEQNRKQYRRQYNTVEKIQNTRIQIKEKTFRAHACFCQIMSYVCLQKVKTKACQVTYKFA